MTLVKTYVFIDLETTGLPKEEYNKTRITELSMVAVKRQHLLDTRPGTVPRMQHKLTLCFNPGRLISVDSTKITGLCNDLLEFEPKFNKEVFTMIDTFLTLLSQPVCLIAQNGLNFDYPILQNHLSKLNVVFTADVLCADCYYGFYHILEHQKFIRQFGNEFIDRELITKEIEGGIKQEESLPKQGTDITSSICRRQSIDHPSSSNINDDSIDYYTSNISMQAINETTPKAKKQTNSKTARIASKTKRRLLYPWGDSPKPTKSYKLKDIYERVLNKQAIDAHRAENDCILAMEVSVALAKQFVEWVDKNHIKFSEIKPMTIGVPMR